MARVAVQEEDFDPGEVLAELSGPGVGAAACFVGLVRSEAAAPLSALVLEHYPGMTERAIGAIAEEAEARFGLLGCVVVHRVGRLVPGARIVMVAASAPHRGDALAATGMLIDWLKTRAPFWKREEYADGRRVWVEAREADDAAAAQWD